MILANFFNRWRPTTVFGRPITDMPLNLRRYRDVMIVALLLEAVVAIASLPLGAARGGITKLSSGINAVLLILSLLGLLGAVKYLLVPTFLHIGLVLGLVALFIVYIILNVTLSVGSGEENTILLAVFAFILVDVVVACMNIVYYRRLSRYEQAVKNGEVQGVNGAPVAVATPAPQQVHVAVASASPITPASGTAAAATDSFEGNVGEYVGSAPATHGVYAPRGAASGGNLNVTTSPAEMPPVGVPVNDPGLRVSAPPPGPAMPPTLPPLPRTQQGYGSDNTAAAMPELNPPPSYSDMTVNALQVPPPTSEEDGTAPT